MLFRHQIEIRLPFTIDRLTLVAYGRRESPNVRDEHHQAKIQPLCVPGFVENIFLKAEEDSEKKKKESYASVEE